MLQAHGNESAADLASAKSLEDVKSPMTEVTDAKVDVRVAAQPMEKLQLARPCDSEAFAGDRRSMMDYVAVAVTVAELPVVMTLDLVSNAVASPRRRRPFRDTFLDSVMGHCYRSSTLAQLRIMTGVRPLKQELSSFLYRCDGTRRKLQHYNAEFRPELPGFSARWVHEIPDRTPDDPVLLYFHGGGYALKTCQPQVQYICELARVFRKQRLSVLVLDYTITPFQIYPSQRNQALECLAALQEECENIILFGDSCGGNLALSILQETEGPRAVTDKPLKGCVLVSPWVDPGAQTGSMNSRRDILSKRRLNEMAASYVTKDQLGDPLVTPLKADAKLWRRVLPKNTCCVWGEIECLADQDAEFVRLAGIEDSFVERNGTHDCILRGMTPPPCRYITQQIAHWIAEIPSVENHGVHPLQAVENQSTGSLSEFTSERLEKPSDSVLESARARPATEKRASASKITRIPEGVAVDSPLVQSSA